MPLAAHDPLVSYFPRIDVTEGGVDRLLSDVMADIRDAKYRYAIEPIREAYRRGGKHDEQYQALKGLLPYFTPGGRFRRRSSDGLILSSGIVQGDIDALNNRQLAWARDSLSSDPHTTHLSLQRHLIQLSVSRRFRCER